jgi:hypothetical protein
MEATKDNNLFQFGGMTLNIWKEKNLQDGLTVRHNFNSFLSFRKYSQP